MDITHISIGDHVVGRQTLRLTGKVEGFFRAEWKPNHRKGCRDLTKHDAQDQNRGPLLCAVRLVRPFSVHDDTSDIPAGVHPVVEDLKTGRVEVVLASVDFLQPIPNGI